MSTKRFFLETYGCQMNEYDSQLVESLLVAAGFEKAEDEKSADIIILNTCSVRQRAEERALGRIRSASSQKRPRQIAVIGCMAQRMGEELVSFDKDVKYVLGTDSFYRIAEVLSSGNGKPVVDVSCREEPIDYKAMPADKRLSDYVTIMRGCDNYCSYCIVPYVRGRERCRPPERIAEEMNRLAESGRREIWLLGQNVNSYNFENMDFPELLRYLMKNTDIPRIRFLTSHPKDFSMKLIETMAENGRICNGIHLPLQSGSDKILKKMNRKYTSSVYHERLKKLRDKIPNVTISTDIIVGFPGEADEDYEDTLRLMEKIEFDSAFMFRYSVREGTHAEKYGDDVPEQVKLSRLDRLIRMQKKITERKMRLQVGNELEVLLEEPARQDSADARGKTDGGINVVVRNASEYIGKMVNVKIKSSSYSTLVGEITS
jgi:tRNA-2-methylthio-N6-dimethylallyladenosine synthase